MEERVVAGGGGGGGGRRRGPPQLGPQGDVKLYCFSGMLQGEYFKPQCDTRPHMPCGGLGLGFR